MMKKLSTINLKKSIFLLVLFAIAGFLLVNYAQAADGSGTNVVVPTTVKSGTTGNTFNFTYTAAETMDSGGISITVPAGWSAPQGNSGTAGYTTVTSASGMIANVVNALDNTTNWSATTHMTLSADSADKQEGTASLSNAITTQAVANEQWYFNYGGATDWGTNNGNTADRIGFWLKSSVNTASGDFSWQDDDTANLASPLDTLAIPALTANTWTYSSVTLGASRATQLSYGFRYTNDIGVATLKADSISKIFDAAESTTGWSSDGSITLSLLTTGGNFKEGTGAIRCAYASGAGIGTSGDCFDNEGSAFTLGPGTTVSFWVRSSIALNAGDFTFVDDNSSNLGSVVDAINLPALLVNTWTYVTLSAPGSGSARSYGLRQAVDKGAMNIDIDALGKVINAADATTGWVTSSDTVQALSADTTTFHENGASLKNVINATAAAGDKWYETFGSAQNWSTYTNVGFWIRSTVATTAGQLKFEYSSASDLTSPIASINIGALSANTWTYQNLTLTGTRTSVSSYGINYATDIGAATVNLDDVLIGPGSPTFPGGGVINVRLLSLANTHTAVVSYGSGGGTSGVTAPSTAGTASFTTKSRASDSGTLTNIASSPTVQVTASKFVIINPTDGTVDAPITVTIQAQDASGAVDTSYQNDVTLVTSGSASGAGLVNIVNGVGTLNISDTVAETVNLSLSDTQSTGLTVTSTQDVIFAPGAVSLFTLNDPGNMTAGTRLGYTVTRKDQFNNLVTAGTTTVYFYSTSGGSNKAFYNVASGGSPITSINITAGNSTANFWYYDELSGTFTITASDNSSAPDGNTNIDDATDSLTVNVGATAQFTLNHPGSITAGNRAAYTVTRKDSFGNLTTSGAQTVYLYSSSGGSNKAFYNVASGGSPITSINITAGNSAVNVWYYDDLSGTFTITASDNSSAPDGTTGIADATDSLIVTAVATKFIVINPTDGTVDAPIAVTVRAEDNFGNIDISYQNDVTLVTDGSATGGGLVDIVNGTGTKNISDHVAQTVNLSLSDTQATGLNIASTQDVIFAPGAVAQFSLNHPGSVTAGNRAAYTVTRKDQYGNSITTGSTTVYLYSSSTGVNKKFYNASSGGSVITSINITAGNSTANFWYYDELSGTFTITASDNSSAPDGATGIADATDSLTVNPAATFQFVLNHPGSITGGNRAAYTVTRKDSFGNLTTSGSNTVYLYSSSTGSNKAFYNVASGGSPITSVVIGSGSLSANFWYYDELSGTFTITASDNATAPDGTTGIDDATDSLVVGSTAAKFVIIDPTDGTVDNPITVTVQAQDSFGAVDTNYQSDVTLVTSGSATGGGLVNIVNGVGTLNISDTVAQTVNLSLSDTQATGLTVTSTQDVIFAPGVVSLFTLNHPGSITAGNRAAYTVTRKDQFNNLVTTGTTTVYLYSSSTGANKKFYDASSGGNIITSINITNGNSTADFWYYDELSGTFTITSSDNSGAPDGTTGIADATDSLTVNPAATSQFLLNDPGDMAAGTRLGYTVTRKDQFNNLVTSGSTTAYLYSSSTGANKKFYDASSGGSVITSINITNGNSTANFWYFDDAAGTWTVTASDNSSAPDGNTGINDGTDSVMVSTTSIVATKYVIINPTDGTVDNPITVTVQAQDNSGNVSTSTQNDVTLVAGGSSTGAGLVNITNGVGTLNISDTVAETVNLSLSDTQSTGLTVTSTQDVIFAPGAVAQFSLNDPGDMTAGTRLGYTVTRKDQFNNLVASGSTTAYLYSSSTGTNKAFYAASSGGSVITSINITNGNSTANVWYYDELSGTFTITASDNSSAPDGNINIDDATDSVTVSAAPIVATKFIIVDPTDGTAGTAITVTVRAEDNSGNLDTSYQNDATLVASGSATGGGLVDIVNGTGTKNINDATAETVNLTLSDTQSTDLNVASTQDVIFSAAPVTPTPTPVPPPNFTTIIRFFGRAYPDAQVTLLAKNGVEEIPLQYTPVVSLSGDFGLEFSGKIYGYKSYGFRITDKDGRSTPAQFYNLDVNLYSVTETSVFAPPTLGLVRQVVGQNDKLSIIGYATPNMNVQLELDGKVLDDVIISDQHGHYEHQLEVKNLPLGDHQLRARQKDTRIGQISDWSTLTLFAVSSIVAPQTDLNNDGIIDISDWSIFLSLWNERDTAAAKVLDFNGDGKVDLSDFSLLMSALRR